MRHLKTFEKYITNHNDEYQILDLKEFNDEESNRLSKLIDLLKGKLVEFNGKHEDDMVYNVYKEVIRNVFFTGMWHYEFETENRQYYNVDNNYPITIYTMESDAKKYNL